jgi:hypothetical protein
MTDRQHYCAAVSLSIEGRIVDAPTRGIPTEEAAELNQLLDTLPAAITCASELLRKTSIEDPTYLAADAEVGKILARINTLINPICPDGDVKR